MATDKSQEPDRMLRLVWRHRMGEETGARGPRKKWSVDQVVDTAIDDADRTGVGGVDSLSMRKIAQKLNTSAASLYTYIPGRDELLGLMVDQVMGRADLPPFDGPATEPAVVTARLREVSRVAWDEIHRHPWLLSAQRHRPLIGPNVSRRYEWQLTALEGCGLDDVAMDHTVALVESHAVASAAADVNARELARTSGHEDAEWWQANEPVLSQVMGDGEFPVSGRVGSTVGEKYQAITDPAAVYRYGLEIILDGVRTRLAAAGATDGA
ncbi:TetR/AcrR family transcriptional regulator C-terminal domain-containing protein [Corynebacterium sp.]|uniref:TetR/AcrR family transcriptional regulator n=1 Tax=Corynebacterium sp. TaxID=1720 RepID=UPI0025BD192C|nr:TetR/AcrR family transcriptional regulator C-terminal domain-containing protein [Corynebacterium sp.]